MRGGVQGYRDRASIRGFSALSLGVLVVMATAVVAEEDAEPVATNAAGGTRVEEEQRPRIRVVSIRTTRQVAYEADSGDPSASAQLMVVLGIRPGSASIRALEEVHLEEATSLAGEELRSLLPAPGSGAGERFWQNLSRRLDVPADSPNWGQGEVRLPVQFAAPVAPIEGFGRIAGELHLRVATGARRKVVMDPLADWVEESVQIRGLPKGFLVTKRPDDGRISLHMSNQLAPLFEDLRLFDAEQEPIALRRASVTRVPGEGAATFTGELASATRAEFVYVDAVETVAVPFVFENLAFRPPSTDDPVKVADPVPDEAP